MEFLFALIRVIVSTLRNIPYSSKFLWSNIFMTFVNYTEITKISGTKIHFSTLKYRAGHFKIMKQSYPCISWKSAKIMQSFAHGNLELCNIYIYVFGKSANHKVNNLNFFCHACACLQGCTLLKLKCSEAPFRVWCLSWTPRSLWVLNWMW